MAYILVSKVIDINNLNDIRGRTHSSSKVSSRSTSSQPYYKRIVINNNLIDENSRKPVDRSQLSYKDNNEERNLISKATNYKSMVVQ